MLVSQVIQQALQLLNYTDSSGRVGSAATHAVTARGLSAVQQIYRDLYYALWPRPSALGDISVGDRVPAPPVTSDTPLTYCREPFSPNESIPLPERLVSDVMPYGVAMLLAQGEGDADNQSVFATIYSQKRAALTHFDKRVDAMPYPY